MASAKEILSILGCWKALYGTIRFAPITLIQVCFSAGTVFLLLAHQAGSGRRAAEQKQADALDKVREVIDFLKELGRSWPGAIKISEIFEKLHDVQRQRMLDLAESARARRAARRASHSAADAIAVVQQSSEQHPPVDFSPTVDQPGSLLCGQSCVHNPHVDAVEHHHHHHQHQQQSDDSPTALHANINSTDSDIGGTSDDWFGGETPFPEYEMNDQEMNDALDMLLNPNAGLHSTGELNHFGAAEWGMPSGNALSYLPFVAVDAQNTFGTPSMATPSTAGNWGIGAHVGYPSNQGYFSGYPVPPQPTTVSTGSYGHNNSALRRSAYEQDGTMLSEMINSMFSSQGGQVFNGFQS